jgi:hypothetical protein
VIWTTPKNDWENGTKLIQNVVKAREPEDADSKVDYDEDNLDFTKKKPRKKRTEKKKKKNKKQRHLEEQEEWRKSKRRCTSGDISNKGHVADGK